MINEIERDRLLTIRENRQLELMKLMAKIQRENLDVSKRILRKLEDTYNAIGEVE